MHTLHTKTQTSSLALQVGELWQKTSEEEKAPYAAMAASDKLRYQAELEAYNYKCGAQKTCNANLLCSSDMIDIDPGAVIKMAEALVFACIAGLQRKQLASRLRKLPYRCMQHRAAWPPIPFRLCCPVHCLGRVQSQGQGRKLASARAGDKKRARCVPGFSICGQTSTRKHINCMWCRVCGWQLAHQDGCSLGIDRRVWLIFSIET